jgi:hypothetical protein
MTSSASPPGSPQAASSAHRRLEAGRDTGVVVDGEAVLGALDLDRAGLHGDALDVLMRRLDGENGSGTAGRVPLSRDLRPESRQRSNEPARPSAATSVTPGQRNRGNALARYATALLELDGPHAALPPATEAVECLQRAPSARMRRELVALRDRAAGRHDDSGGRDLVEVLQTMA